MVYADLIEETKHNILTREFLTYKKPLLLKLN